MRAPVTTHDLECLELSASTDARGQRAVSLLLQSWARQEVPGDTVSRGRLLVAASEHSAFAGDARRALRLARQALATGHHVAPDTRCYVVSALLLCGRTHDAVRLAHEVIDERGDDVEAFVFLGDEFAWHRDDDEAARIYTLGLFRCAEDDEDTDALLGAWRRSRSPHGVVDVRLGQPVPVRD